MRPLSRVQQPHPPIGIRRDGRGGGVREGGRGDRAVLPAAAHSPGQCEELASALAELPASAHGRAGREHEVGFRRVELA